MKAASPKPASETATDLRGALPRASLGTRGIERMARNPECLRLAALTLAGASPGDARRLVYGDDHDDRRSPFALGRGQRFEKDLLDHDAAGLVALYVAAGRLPSAGVAVRDLTRNDPGAEPDALARRRAETLRLLALAGDARSPRVLLKPRFQIVLAGERLDVEPDAMVLCEGEDFFRVVEIKSWLDRDGRTSAPDLRSACRQAAVGVVAVREALRALGAPSPERVAPAHADLVLARATHAGASLRPMTLEAEVASVAAALDRAPAVLAAVRTALGGRTLDDRAALDALAAHYRPNCREYCGLASRCREEAACAADPVALGDAARETLAPVGNVVWAIDLFRGRRAPENDEQRALARRLQSAWEALQKTVSDVE